MARTTMADRHSRDGASSHEPSFAERISHLSKKRRELIRPVQEHPRDYVLLSIRESHLARQLPFHGVTVNRGKLILPDGPGLGLNPA